MGDFELVKSKIGALIQKPKMTDKLLGKPPFRFLHDTISAVITTTGFAEGLYSSEEQDSSNITDKNAKIDYLNKIFTCVGLCQGAPLEVKAIKVVAGQEPELTCEFLIAFADCAANSDVDSEAAVRKTLNGEQAVNGPPLLKNNGSKDSGSKSDRSSNRLEDNDAKGGSGSMSMADAKDEAPIAPERGQSRSGSRGGARTSLPTADSAGLSDPIVNLDSELAKCDGSIAATQSLLGSVITRPKLSDKLLGKPPFKFLHDIVSEVIKSTGFGTNLFAPEEMDNSKVTGKEAKLAYLEKIIQLVGVQLQTNLRDVQPMKIIQGLEADSTNRFLQHLAVAAIHSPDSTKAVRTVLDQLGGTSNETPLQATANPAPDPVESEESPPSKEITFAPSVAEDKNSASPRQMQPDDKNPNNHGMGIGAPPSNFNTPSSGFEEEKQVSMRPTSALRRPPKVKERTRDATHDFASTTVTKKAEGLIMDGEEIDEDEDILDGMGGDVKRLADDLQVVGAAVSSPAPANAESKIVQDIRNRQAEQEALSRGNISNPNFGADEKEEPLDGPGGEAKSGGIRLGKKKLSSRGSKSGSKDPNAGSSSSKSSSGSATDIEKLRNCIQMLVKYTGPLGSCMEYIQEDIGLMTNELKKWEEESRKYEAQLDTERQITEENLKPLNNELSELDEKIKDEMLRISAMKANIARNEGKIQQILKTIATA